jgi:hypothetical protein
MDKTTAKVNKTQQNTQKTHYTMSYPYRLTPLPELPVSLQDPDLTELPKLPPSLFTDFPDLHSSLSHYFESISREKMYARGKADGYRGKPPSSEWREPGYIDGYNVGDEQRKNVKRKYAKRKRELDDMENPDCTIM